MSIICAKQSQVSRLIGACDSLRLITFPVTTILSDFSLLTEWDFYDSSKDSGCDSNVTFLPTCLPSVRSYLSARDVYVLSVPCPSANPLIF